MKSSVGLVALMYMSATTVAQTQSIGNRRQGLKVARVQCAECHRVADEQRNLVSHAAPSFDQIANMPGMTSTALVVALRTSHRQMPNVIIADKDMRDLIAYILSLKNRP